MSVTTGSVTAPAPISVNLVGELSALVTVSGIYTGVVLEFLLSDDGVNFYATNATRLDTLATESTRNLGATNQAWYVPVTGGQAMQVNFTAIATGTAKVRITTFNIPVSALTVAALSTNNVGQVGGTPLFTSPSGIPALPTADQSLGLYLSGTTSPTTTTAAVSLGSILEAPGAIFDARSVFIGIVNTTNQAITSASLVFSDTLGGDTLSVVYPLSLTGSIAATNGQASVLVSLNQGIYQDVALVATYGVAPSSGTVDALATISSSQHNGGIGNTVALNAVTANTTSNTIYLGGVYANVAMQVVLTGFPTGGQVILQGSLDGVNFDALYTEATSAGSIAVFNIGTDLSGAIKYVTGHPITAYRVMLAGLVGGSSPTVTVNVCNT